MLLRCSQQPYGSNFDRSVLVLSGAILPIWLWSFVSCTLIVELSGLVQHHLYPSTAPGEMISQRNSPVEDEVGFFFRVLSFFSSILFHPRSLSFPDLKINQHLILFHSQYELQSAYFSSTFAEIPSCITPHGISRKILYCLNWQFIQ